MKVTTLLAERIAGHPFLRDLPREFLPLLADNALDVTFAADEIIFRTGDPANRFYLLEAGEVQLESRNGGGPVSIQRIGAGDVLGWSWLFPPYQWQFDARAITETRAIFLYGSRLRDACEQEPVLGYALMRATAGVLMERLQSTRRELLRCVAKANV
jgi:CRP-like cAMP-binding protein